MKNIVLIQPAYPYGKKQTFLGGSLIALASQLESCGYTAIIIDLNLQKEEVLEEYYGKAYFGITVVGSPYIPTVITLANKIYQNSKTKVLIGGQGIEYLKEEDFISLFQNTAIQITNDLDLMKTLNTTEILPSAYNISFKGVMSKLEEKIFKKYLSTEMTLVISQGCHFKCKFCAAKKSQREKFKNLAYFEEDLEFLAISAKKLNIKQLNFYATSLDFFQNPKIIFQYLNLSAKIQKRTGVKFKIRCLSTLSSFRDSVLLLGENDFRELMKLSGLYCVGFGVDGADPKVWKAQKKSQNNLSIIKDCLDLALKTGITSEILMVMGFPQDNFKTLLKCFTDSIKYIMHWPNTILRPYLAKEFIPGNDNWDTLKADNGFIKDPKKFYNLDFCAIVQ